MQAQSSTHTTHIQVHKTHGRGERVAFTQVDAGALQVRSAIMSLRNASVVYVRHFIAEEFPHTVARPHCKDIFIFNVVPQDFRHGRNAHSL